MKFFKMHGIGNDYIYFDCMEKDIEDKPSLAIKVSKRHTGIGSDGAIFICKSDKADAEMQVYNADGSYAEMCGNGIRCVAKYLFDRGYVDKTDLVIESGGALKYISLEIEKEEPSSVTGKLFSKREDGMVAKMIRVDMGAPILIPSDIPVSIPGFTKDIIVSEEITVCDTLYKMTCVSMGNPHCIVFVDDVKNFDVEGIGHIFEKHEYFPKRINTEFVRVIDRKNVEMRVCERGAGETEACGTGATATAVASILNGYTEDELIVHLLGGDLKIFWDRNGSGHAFMTGPAEFICEGDV